MHRGKTIPENIMDAFDYMFDDACADPAMTPFAKFFPEDTAAILFEQSTGELILEFEDGTSKEYTISVTTKK